MISSTLVAAIVVKFVPVKVTVLVSTSTEIPVIVAVGAIVPYAEAGVGAIATQAWGNPRFGPLGLELLKSGRNGEDTLNEDALSSLPTV